VVPGTSSLLVNTAEPRAPPSRVCNLQPVSESVCLSVCLCLSGRLSLRLSMSVSPCVYIWTGAEIPIHGPPNPIQNAIQNSRFQSRTGSPKWIRIPVLELAFESGIESYSKPEPDPHHRLESQVYSGVWTSVSPVSLDVPVLVCLNVYLRVSRCLPLASLPACCGELRIRLCECSSRRAVAAVLT